MIKNILITGASQGLGRALALQFAGKNCRIYAVARSENLLRELAQYSELIVPIVADISLEAGRQQIYQQIDRNQALSIIHNAAIAIPGLFSDDSDMQQQFATNYFAPLEITRHLQPLLKGQRVLHISSGAANIAMPGLLAYSASKAALEQAARCLNAELNSQQMYFSVLRPGMIDTGMQLGLRSSDPSKLPNCEFYQQAAKQHKLADPSEVAKFVIDVILKTDNELFSKTVWNIYDEAQRKKLQALEST